ncbi:MAG: hypothetical protein N2Z70_05805, partial [Bdellovibrionaceae bacterium]|nr:hypothetical protein [Pseudobdellovibrionaceae bacterium]
MDFQQDVEEGKIQTLHIQQDFLVDTGYIDHFLEGDSRSIVQTGVGECFDGLSEMRALSEEREESFGDERSRREGGAKSLELPLP